MAGRILPVALATISGIAIGMATFGEELKAQQMKRLTEEYNRDIAAAAAAAAAAANSENPAAIAPTATTITPSPAATPSPIKDETKPTKASWSDTLGFWAWKSKPQQDPMPASLAAPAVAPEAPVKNTVEGQIKKP